MTGEDLPQISVVKRDAVRRGESSGAMTRVGAISGDTVGSQGIFMGISRLPPGLRSSGHVHTNCESSLYVASGHGRFLTGGGLDHGLAIEPGDFIYVPVNAPHAVVNDSDVDLVFIVARNSQREEVEEYGTPTAAPATTPST